MYVYMYQLPPLEQTTPPVIRANNSPYHYAHFLSYVALPFQAGALQDKIGELADQLPSGWNSRLSQAVKPSHKPALF